MVLVDREGINKFNLINIYNKIKRQWIIIRLPRIKPTPIIQLWPLRLSSPISSPKLKDSTSRTHSNSHCDAGVHRLFTPISRNYPKERREWATAKRQISLGNHRIHHRRNITSSPCSTTTPKASLSAVPGRNRQKDRI